MSQVHAGKMNWKRNRREFFRQKPTATTGGLAKPVSNQSDGGLINGTAR
jgi:hypothetical protein